MTGQEVAAAVLVCVAGLYLALRVIRRRAGNCCGEKECPATKEITKRLARTRKAGAAQAGPPPD